MKRFILNLLCIVTFLLWNSSLFAGTTKLSADSVINFLIGKWNWTSTNGGVLGVIIGPSSVNYTKSIVFSQHGTAKDSIDYEVFKNDTSIEKSTYKFALSDDSSRVIISGIPNCITIGDINSFTISEENVLYDNLFDHYVRETKGSKFILCNLGKLSTHFSQTEMAAILNLTITGTIDARDFKTMRDSMPNLTTLDLSDVTISEYNGLNGTFYESSNSPIDYPQNSIPQEAFIDKRNNYKGKTSLKTIVFPKSIQSIGENAFLLCLNLQNITIPSNVTSIGLAAFANCSGPFSVDSNNIHYKSVAGVLYDKTLDTLLSFPSSIVGDYSIRDGVKVIANTAMGSSQLHSIIIPSTVTEIDNWAFGNNYKLTSVTIPSSVTKFMGCTFYYDTLLTSVYALSRTPVDLTNAFGTFCKVDTSKCHLYVPVGSANAYKAAVQWKDFKFVEEYVPAPQITSNAPVIGSTYSGNPINCKVTDSLNGGFIKWYTDSTLTTLVGTGNTYIFNATTTGLQSIYTTRTIGSIVSTITKTELNLICQKLVKTVIKTIDVPLYKGSIILKGVDGMTNWENTTNLIANSTSTLPYQNVGTGITYTLPIENADTTYTIYAVNEINVCQSSMIEYHITITNDLPFVNTTDTTLDMNIGDSIDVVLSRNDSPKIKWTLKNKLIDEAVDTTSSYYYDPIEGAKCNCIHTDYFIYNVKALKSGIDTLVWEGSNGSINYSKRIICKVGTQIVQDTCPKIVMKPINESICTPLDKKNPTTLNINYTHQFTYLYKPLNVYPVDTIIAKSTLGINPQEVGITVHFNNGCSVYAPDSIIVTQYTSPSTPQIHDFYFEPNDIKLLSLDSAVDKNCQSSWSCTSYGNVLFLGKTLQLNTFFNTIGEYPFIVQFSDSISHCSSIEASFTVTVMNPTLPSISGQIQANSNPFNDGIVQLFKQKGTHYSAISTQSINTDGSFTFKWLDASNYLIRVLPNDLQSVYLPTYYVSSTTWQDANVIALQGTIQGLHLSMAQCDAIASGNGSITGVVDVLDSNFASRLKAFAPITMPVMVMQNGQIVAYALTDADGNYKVANLPDGTYDVYVEVPGYAKYTTPVSITNGSSTTASFTLKNGTVETAESIETSDDISLYPNPAAETVMVKTSKTVKYLEVVTIEGVVVQKLQGNQKVLDISQLSPGMYLVKIISEKGITVKQLIKQSSVLR